MRRMSGGVGLLQFEPLCWAFLITADPHSPAGDPRDVVGHQADQSVRGLRGGVVRGGAEMHFDAA